MQTCGPCAKARWRRAFSRRTSKRSGSANDAGSRFAPAIETVTRSPRGDRRAAELDVARRVAVDHRRGRLEPQRLLDRVRAAGRGRPRPARAASGCASRCRSALAIMPSVVSMPPNISTAAFETTSSCVEPAGLAGRGRQQRRVGVRRRARARCVARSAANASRPSPSTGLPGGHLRDRRDDRVVPAEHAPGVRRPRGPSAYVDDRDGERPRERRAAAPRALPARARRSAARSPPPRAAVNRSRTASSRNGRANGSRWRRVLGAVEREHARPDDLPGREARVVDGERLRRRASPAARGRGRVTSQPSSAGSHDTGSPLAQAREQRVRVAPRAPRGWRRRRSGTSARAQPRSSTPRGRYAALLSAGPQLLGVGDRVRGAASPSASTS